MTLSMDFFSALPIGGVFQLHGLALIAVRRISVRRVIEWRVPEKWIVTVSIPRVIGRPKIAVEVTAPKVTMEIATPEITVEVATAVVLSVIPGHLSLSFFTVAYSKPAAGRRPMPTCVPAPLIWTTRILPVPPIEPVADHAFRACFSSYSDSHPLQNN